MSNFKTLSLHLKKNLIILYHHSNTFSMKKIYTTLIILIFSFQIFGQDTFSIVAVDSIKGQVGSAGASCVDGAASVGGVQFINQIIPGRGGVNAQAFVCINPHINLDNAITQMSLGSSPQEILDWLVDNDACNAGSFNPELRQYGIADFDSLGSPRAAAFTGVSTDDYKGHRVGPNYAIQGNILLGPEILDQMEANFLNTNGSLAEKLMAALQGANVPGADSRCLARGTSSTSGYLRVYGPDDAQGDPLLELSILEMPFGEEPIDSLQTLFDIWTTSTSTKSVFGTNNVEVNIFPNPVSDILNVSFKMSDGMPLQLEVVNLAGQRIAQSYIQATNGLNEKINTKNLPQGIYYLHIKSQEEDAMILKFVKN